MSVFDFDEEDLPFYYDIVDYWIEKADRFVLVTPFVPYDLPSDAECEGLSEEESDEALSRLYN
jgi:hypothetical protein